MQLRIFNLYILFILYDFNYKLVFLCGLSLKLSIKEQYIDVHSYLIK